MATPELPKVGLASCPSCQKDVAWDAMRCPGCGGRTQLALEASRGNNRIVRGLLLGLVAGALPAVLSGLVSFWDDARNWPADVTWDRWIGWGSVWSQVGALGAVGGVLVAIRRLLHRQRSLANMRLGQPAPEFRASPSLRNLTILYVGLVAAHAATTLVFWLQDPTPSVGGQSANTDSAATGFSANDRARREQEISKLKTQYYVARISFDLLRQRELLGRQVVQATHSTCSYLGLDLVGQPQADERSASGTLDLRFKGGVLGGEYTLRFTFSGQPNKTTSLKVLSDNSSFPANDEHIAGAAAGFDSMLATFWHGCTSDWGELEAGLRRGIAAEEAGRNEEAKKEYDAAKVRVIALLEQASAASR